MRAEEALPFDPHPDWRDSALSVNEGVAIPVEGPPAVGCLIEIEP